MLIADIWLKLLILNQLDISKTLNVEKSYVIFRESNDNMISCNCTAVIFPSGAVILSSAEKFFCPRHVRRTATWRHIWKLPILPGWHVLRKLWHNRKVPRKKFITIRKQLVYSPKWSRNQQLSLTVSESNNYPRQSAKDSKAHGL